MKKIALLILIGIISCLCGKTIRIASLEWDPYTGKDLKNEGLMSDIVRSAFEKVGYEVEFHYAPWARTYEKTKEGKFDAIMGLSYKLDRENYFSYSDVVFENEIVFLMRKDHDFTYASNNDLKGKTIGIIKNSFLANVLAQYDIKSEGYSNLNTLVRVINGNRIELAADYKIAFQKAIIDEGLKEADFKFTERAFIKDRIHVGFSKKVQGHEELRDKFNDGLVELKTSGDLKRIFKAHNLHQD
jgi:polar amino acid transport system substrate-binding protein